MALLLTLRGSRCRDSRAAAAILILGLVSWEMPARAEVPAVSADVSTVSSEPPAGDGHFRMIVSVSEVYHHVFIDWVALGEEGSSPAIAGRYAVKDEDLGGGKVSVKYISGIEWKDYHTVELRVNDRADCTLSLGRTSYEASCK